MCRRSCFFIISCLMGVLASAQQAPESLPGSNLPMEPLVVQQIHLGVFALRDFRTTELPLGITYELQSFAQGDRVFTIYEGKNHLLRGDYLHKDSTRLWKVRLHGSLLSQANEDLDENYNSLQLGLRGSYPWLRKLDRLNFSISAGADWFMLDNKALIPAGLLSQHQWQFYLHNTFSLGIAEKLVTSSIQYTFTMQDPGYAHDMGIGFAYLQQMDARLQLGGKAFFRRTILAKRQSIFGELEKVNYRNNTPHTLTIAAIASYDIRKNLQASLQYYSSIGVQELGVHTLGLEVRRGF